MLEINELIDHKLSDLLKKYTSRMDRIQISSQHDSTEYVLKNVVYRESKVKNKDIPAISALVFRAIESASKANFDAEYLKLSLKGFTAHKG